MDRSAYGKLSVSLMRDITMSELSALKQLLKDYFGEGELEKMRDFFSVWNALERYGKIKPGDLRYLRDRFEDIGAITLVDKVNNAMGYKKKGSKHATTSDASVSKSGYHLSTPLQPTDARELKPKVTSESSEYFRDPVYDFSKLPNKMKNQGVMLIINQFRKKRSGTEEDANALKDLFEGELGFHVDLRHNQTKKRVIEALRDKVHMMKDNSVERFFCVILSHGNENGIYCCDENEEKELQIKLENEILPMFRADKLEEMAGRPKVFIVQACRGLEYQTGVPVSDADPEDNEPKGKIGSTTSERPMGPLIIPNEADFLVAYPQTEGFRSFRNEAVGSWFIQSLVKVFKACYREYDLVRMLTEVNYHVSQRNHCNSFQMPCFMSSLRKCLFLGSAPPSFSR